MGVSLTERPQVIAADWLTRAYYSLGLFVVGGLDIGTPSGGPSLARGLLWVAYFGAPLLTASAVIEAVLRVVSPHRWQFRWLKNHIVIAGTGKLTSVYLRALRAKDSNVSVVVVADEADPVRDQELRDTFGVTVVAGDITRSYLQKELRVGRARRVLLMSDDNFQCYEAASKMLARYPRLAEGRVILHCHRIRFMRAMEGTQLANQCETFNIYHLAATALVRNLLTEQFRKTQARDLVVMAGFGRFGQTVLEELANNAGDEIEAVAVIDADADRRVLVVDEQQRLSSDFRREVYEGDISHPEVWRQLTDTFDLTRNEPTVILGTGSEEDNLRTALWIKRKYPNLFVYARTNDVSEFALDVSAEYGINSISITELFELNIPARWLA
ncbi:MAG: potassium transporter TrkA [Gammaproteobacteria bacterium]|nr:potassium transporter TrkA [Gammaproteobacteria bacterium]